MSQLDMVLHPPARLQIGAVLAQTTEVEFARLREIAGVSDSVLSKHLSALVEAGYVTLKKSPMDGRQRTWAMFTRAGRKAFAAHIAALKAIVAAASPDALAPEKAAAKEDQNV
ncbi:transcriptional regulator [Novosphingobium sp. 9]|uniref:transcriptional regulator n=1 Tax=Novosphingobium sp. 9 TaxID=2025349 RepID=UPI0021B4DEC7|nr:transcriptional regulator [Novosphingobium sp. 9]